MNARASAAGPAPGKAGQLAEQKDALSKDVDSLKSEIEQLANQQRNGNQRQVARKLDEAVPVPLPTDRSRKRLAIRRTRFAAADRSIATPKT